MIKQRIFIFQRAPLLPSWILDQHKHRTLCRRLPNEHSNQVHFKYFSAVRGGYFEENYFPIGSFLS